MKVQLKVASGAKVGQLVPINRQRFLIGRAEDCHLKPKSDLISRYHCAILSEDGYVAVRDLGSKNGVFLNGHRVAVEEELKNGDRLVLGPLEFDVILTVTLSAEKKSKVESMAEVIARAVEQQSKSRSADLSTESALADAVAEEEPVPQEEEPIEVAPEPPAETVAVEVPPTTKTKKSSESEDLADWLLDGDSDSGAENRAAQAEQLAELGLNPAPEDDPTLAKKGVPAKEEMTRTAPQKKAPAADGTMPDPDAAANLLKNFFQEQ